MSAAGVDYIVVQSYDGQLTFFEQEVQSFSRLLPGFLLPGPLAYMAASDSFITATAGLELVSYRYNSIAAANWDPKQQQGRVICGLSGLRTMQQAVVQSSVTLAVCNTHTPLASCAVTCRWQWWQADTGRLEGCAGRDSTGHPVWQCLHRC